MAEVDWLSTLKTRAAGTTTNHTHGYVWDHGSLRTVDDPHGPGATTVTGINNHGQIVGFYTDKEGNVHGFVGFPR